MYIYRFARFFIFTVSIAFIGFVISEKYLREKLHENTNYTVLHME